MKTDWIAKLQHMLQTLAFCLAVAAVLYGFLPDQPYAPQLAYSVAIGMTIWAVIDLGRELFPSAAETGWPTGMNGVLLVVGGIVVGYLFGTTVADQACRYFGWYESGSQAHPATDRRISILVTALAGLVGSYWFYAQNKSAYLERKMTEARRHADEARLKLLETQLEPHMLFNTLANLRALIGVDPPRAQQMLDHMIAYLRATLGASRSTTHALRAEFDRLRDYLELMAIRMGPRLAFTLDLPPELEQRRVPTLLLQPLVENSIRHGLEPQLAGGRITVSANADAGRLVLEVADTGTGTAAASDGQGFGLAQIRERLATLYGDGASIDFAATPDQGARAIIRLPLEDA